MDYTGYGLYSLWPIQFMAYTAMALGLPFRQETRAHPTMVHHPVIPCPSCVRVRLCTRACVSTGGRRASTQVCTRGVRAGMRVLGLASVSKPRFAMGRHHRGGQM